jgi:antibiotic biosynthesis monooxygenase (ABM) superfamily enzyme
MVYVTQLVYVNPGKEATFDAFEGAAIPLIAQHGGQLLLRLRPTPASVIAAGIEVPYEVHIVRFNSADDFKAFAESPDRERIVHLKTESVRFSILVTGTAS